MIKTAVPDSSATRSKTDAKTSNKDKSPSSPFIGAALSMGWQLAAVVLIPVVGGIELDKHLSTAPYFTLAGFILGAAGAYVIVKKSFDEFNQASSQKDKK